VEKREPFKIIEISGRRWRLDKLDPLTGSFLATKIASRLSNLVMGIVAGAINDPAMVTASIANELGAMDKGEFVQIQTDALSAVKELKMVGEVETPSPLRLNGKWAAEGLSEDVVLVMALTAHSIIFNVSPFFDGNALKGIITTFKDSLPFDASILTNLHTPR
jgi:hypothetical protein